MLNWLKKNLFHSFLYLTVRCNVLWALNIVNSSDIRVNENIIYDQNYPAIASLGNSKFAISYSSESNLGNTFGLYARIFDSNGYNLTSEFLVTESTSASYLFSSIESLNNGESFVITWINTDYIFAKIFSSLGLNLTGDIIVSYSAHYHKPTVCSLVNERYFAVTWKSFNELPLARLFHSNGSDLGLEFQVSTNFYSSRNPSVTSLDHGSSFLIVWGYEDIYMKKYHSNGTNMTSQLQVNLYSSGTQSSPAVAEIENGYVVTWQDESSKDGNGWGIFARVFASNGTAITSDFQVNEYYLEYQAWPQIASMDDGKKFIITWQSDGQDSSSYGIIGRVFDSFGSSLTSDFIANSYVQNGQWFPVITGFRNSNSFLISWSSDNQDGSGRGVYVKIFSIQNCNNISDYFYTHNETCLPNCSSKGFTPNNTAGILTCNLICKNGLFYLDYNSSCSNCTMKGYRAVGVYCEMICNSSQHYHSYNNSCLDSCPIDLNMYRQTTTYGAKLCDFICDNNTYLLLNQSCVSTCNFYGFQPQIVDGKKLCKFNCSFGNYLMTSNNTCQSSCDSVAFIGRNQSIYLFCDFKCSISTDFYFPANNTCHSACPSMHYNNYTHHICSSCSNFCDVCLDSSYCSICMPPYQSINGICAILNSTNGTNFTNSTNNTNISSTPVFTPSLSKENIVGSLNLPSIQLLALSSDEKTVYITSNNGKNLLAIDVQDLQNPFVLNSMNLTNCQALRLVENLMYLADSSSGVKIFDASNPRSLISLGIIPQTNVKDLVIDKTRKILILANLDGIITLYNIENLNSPFLISSMPITLKYTALYKMTLSNDEKRIYISSSTGFYTADISNSAQPAVLNSIEYIFPNSHASNSLDYNIIYLTEASGGIKILDMTDSKSPKIIESIASSQIQSISCYSANCFVSSGSNLIVFESSKVSSLSNKGAVPTYSLANAFAITKDTKYGFLIDGTTSLRILDFQSSPAYFLFMKHNEMEIGRKYTDNLLIYNLAADGTYDLFSVSYKFSKLSFYAVSFNPDSSLSKTFTNLPYWIDFDTSTNTISSNPDSASLIGKYNLYGAFSFSIPKNIFIGIGPISNIEQSIDLIIQLSRYIDENLYLTSSFDSNKILLLKEPLMAYEKEIRKKLAQYYFPMLTVLQVVSSLKLNQNYDTHAYLNITTASLYSITISLTFNSTKVRFMSVVTQALAKINEDGNSILLTAALSDLNQALYNLRVDMKDSNILLNGIVIINDALNPFLTVNITKMDRFFLKNSSPRVNIPIQKQIKSISIVTGSQMNIFLDPNSFLDPDKDSLTYKLISTNDEDNLPSWIDFKNLMLTGIPPDQFYYELTLIIRASDGYKSIDDQFTLKIEPSLWYLFQLGASFAGPIIGILGLWVYASKIYNVFCRRYYQYPKSFTVQSNNELSIHQIYPIVLLSEYLKEAEILILMMKNEIAGELKLKKISNTSLVEYFLCDDKNNGLNSSIDEEKIVHKIKKITSENSSRLMALNLRNYSYDLKYSQNRIHSLIIFKLYFLYLAHPAQYETKRVFQRIKRNWICHVDIDRMEPIGSDGLPNFTLRKSFHEYPKINAILLEKAMISYAQFKHNIKSEMIQIKIAAKQKSNRQSLLGKIDNFLNGDSSSASNDMEESIRHGINYYIELDIIYFKGMILEHFKGKTLIINISNIAGRILRQFKIKESQESFQKKGLKSRLKDKKVVIGSRPLKPIESKNICLQPFSENIFSDQSQDTILPISIRATDKKLTLNCKDFDPNQLGYDETSFENPKPSRTKFMRGKVTQT